LRAAPRLAGIAIVVAVIVTRAARPAPSVGGLRRGAPRLRSPCRFSFHRRAASPAPSVGGLRRGAPRLRSPCRFSFHRRAASPAPSVGGLRRGAPRLRSPCRFSRQRRLHRRRIRGSRYVYSTSTARFTSTKVLESKNTAACTTG